MPAIRKTFEATIMAIAETPDVAKAVTPDTEAGGLRPGQFKALVSVFGNTDSYGDIVEKGAFSASLKTWDESGNPIPLVWSHDFMDHSSILGEMTAEETDAGLEIIGTFDLERSKPAEIYRLMQRKLLSQFSFSGEVLKYELIKKDDDDDAEGDDDLITWQGLRLKEIDLWEAGPCFKGANPETKLIGIKASDYAGDLGKRLEAQNQTTKTSPPTAPEEATEAPSKDVESVDQDVQRTAAATHEELALAALALMAIN